MANGISGTNLEFHGSHGVILEDPGTVHISRFSLATCTSVFKIEKSRYTLLPKIGDRHPIFDFLSIESSELALKGAFAVLTASFAGVNAQYDDQNPVYELVVGVSEEPIQLHPRFKSTIAGTPIAPLHGAMFKDRATGLVTFNGGPFVPITNKGYDFAGFMVMDTESTQNPYGGIDHYLSAEQITWRRTVTRKTPATEITKVGTIQTPKGPAPQLPAGRNWLNMGLTQTKRGSAYTSVEEWRSSARVGWISEIYRA